MQLPAILFAAYVVVGVVVATAIAAGDFAKKRTSIAGLLGDVAAFHAIGFLIFLVLWPLWLTLLMLSGKEEPRPSEPQASRVDSPSPVGSNNEDKVA